MYELPERNGSCPRSAWNSRKRTFKHVIVNIVGIIVVAVLVTATGSRHHRFLVIGSRLCSEFSDGGTYAFASAGGSATLPTRAKQIGKWPRRVVFLVFIVAFARFVAEQIELEKEQETRSNDKDVRDERLQYQFAETAKLQDIASKDAKKAFNSVVFAKSTCEL